MTLLNDGGLTRGQVGAAFYPPIQAGGVVYAPEYANGTFASTTAMAANLLYTMPLFISNPRGVALRGLHMLAGTAVASALGRMMLFGSNAYGEPGALIADTNANVDMNTGAATPLTADFAADYVPPTGLYYPAVVFNGLAQPWSFAPSAIGGNGTPSRLGMTDLRAVVAAGNGARIYSRITGAFTFGGALPTAFPTFAYGTNTPGAPLLGVLTR